MDGDDTFDAQDAAAAAAPAAADVPGTKDMTAGAGVLGAGAGVVGALGGAGALAGGAAIGAGALGGYLIGEGIEEETHAGEHLGDFMYDHSNPDDAAAATAHFDDASSDWDKGNYLDAAGDAAEGVGRMVEGFFE